MQIEIPAHRHGEFIATIEKLNKKAVKLNCPPMTVTPIRERVQAVPTTNNTTQWATYLTFEVRGEVPVLDGWEFLAALEHTENGNVVRTMANDGEVPEAYRHADADCDHCGWSRKRKDTFMVRHEEVLSSGEIMVDVLQVGSTCLKDFLGGADPAAVLGRLSAFRKIERLAAGWASEPLPLEALCPTLLDYLSVVAFVVDEHGWVSRGQARMNGGRATADVAADMMTSPAYPDFLRPLDCDRALKAREYVNTVIGAKTDQSDYEHNLHTVCVREFVEHRHMGIAASAINAYRRATAPAEDREQRPTNFATAWFGKVGERYDLALKCIGSFGPYDGRFGSVHISKFTDSGGRLFVVWTKEKMSKRRYSVRGTVRSHDDYKGDKQTVLNRCKVEAI